MICPLLNFGISSALVGPPGLSNEETFALLREREELLARGIDLVGGMRIRRVSAEDLKDLEQISSLIPSDAKLSSDKFVLEKFMEAEQPYSLEVDQLIRNTVLALRLFKEDYVSRGPAFFVRVSGTRAVESWIHEEKRRSLYFPPKYVLRPEETATLDVLLRKILDTDFAAHRNVDLACRRFQHACEEEDVDDQLIDLMIALEALFLKGTKSRSSPGEMIAIACAHLLGKDTTEIEVIREQLTKAYSMRNRIVHGSECSTLSVDRVPEIIRLNHTAEAYLRRSIKRLLD